jgi:AraC-like DNA-binding protein
MFRYLGHGARDYRTKPIPIHRRNAWEFQAVLAGRIAPTLRGEGRPRFRSRCLWLLPPGLAHGWTGDGDTAQVAVFHLAEVPVLLREAAGEQGLEVPLDEAEAAQLASWAQSLDDDRRRPSSHGILRGNAIAAQLCLLAARALPERPLLASPDRDRLLVDDAAAWLGEHLHEGVGIADAARALGLSTPHLRRLVHRVRGCSPRGLLAALRMARARELLADPALGASTVAAACGLASVAAFSRTCRRLSGKPPRELRSLPAG